jgi:hypothetical protein
MRRSGRLRRRNRFAGALWSPGAAGAASRLRAIAPSTSPSGRRRHRHDALAAASALGHEPKRVASSPLPRSVDHETAARSAAAFRPRSRPAGRYWRWSVRPRGSRTGAPSTNPISAHTATSRTYSGTGASRSESTIKTSPTTNVTARCTHPGCHRSAARPSEHETARRPMGGDIRCRRLRLPEQHAREGNLGPSPMEATLTRVASSRDRVGGSAAMSPRSAVTRSLPSRARGQQQVLAANLDRAVL